MARKTIWYKRAVLGTVHNRTLQSAMVAALGRLRTTGARIRSPGVDEAQELINGFATRNGMLCGQFLTFKAGQTQTLLRGRDTAESFDLEAMAPTRERPDERREFLDGVAYFGVHGNHILLCQSKAAGSRELERYLNWLLWEATDVLPRPTAVVIEDAPSRRIAEKVNNNPVKSVTLGTPVIFEPVAAPETRTRVNTVRVTPTGRAAEVLKSLFADTIFDQTRFQDSIRDDNIEVEVTVRFKNKQHISPSGESLLRTVARAARHLNSDDIEIELHKAGTIRGNDFRVHTSQEIATLESGLLHELDLNQFMANWLQQLLDNRMIEP